MLHPLIQRLHSHQRANFGFFRFVDTLMRFGMGMLHTPTKIERLAPIVRPCYAALGLANDYFSFDVEWEEYQQNSSNQKAMTNLVWLCMHWNNVNAEEGKRQAREVTNRIEKEYRERVSDFISGEGAGSIKLQNYLTALGHQIPGNVAWSLRCPRYHPGLCEDAGNLLEKEWEKTKNIHGLGDRGNVSDSKIWFKHDEESDSGSDVSVLWSASNYSPRSSISSTSDGKHGAKKTATLGKEVLRIKFSS